MKIPTLADSAWKVLEKNFDVSFDHNLPQFAKLGKAHLAEFQMKYRTFLDKIILTLFKKDDVWAAKIGAVADHKEFIERVGKPEILNLLSNEVATRLFARLKGERVCGLCKDSVEGEAAVQDSCEPVHLFHIDCADALVQTVDTKCPITSKKWEGNSLEFFPT